MRGLCSYFTSDFMNIMKINLKKSSLASYLSIELVKFAHKNIAINNYMNVVLPDILLHVPEYNLRARDKNARLNLQAKSHRYDCIVEVRFKVQGSSIVMLPHE